MVEDKGKKRQFECLRELIQTTGPTPRPLAPLSGHRGTDSLGRHDMLRLALIASPHLEKSDCFHRLVSLIDSQVFTPRRKEFAPFTQEETHRDQE